MTEEREYVVTRSGATEVPLKSLGNGYWTDGRFMYRMDAETVIFCGVLPEPAHD